MAGLVVFKPGIAQPAETDKKSTTIRKSLGEEIEVPSRVDGKRRYLARVSDFVSWDSKKVKKV